MTTMLDIDERRPGAKLLMAPAARIKGLLAEHASEAEGLLSVTMLCCGESAHAEATRFTEFLGEKLGPEIDFQVRHWTFDELQRLRPGMVATQLTEETHVLVLVTEEPQELPVRVRKWIASWLNEARPWYALVCLCATRDDDSGLTASHGLQNACRQAGVGFFASSFPAQAKELQVSVRSARFKDPLLAGISHWGINE